MKKKVLLALIITVMVAGGVFAQLPPIEFSAGLGGTFGAFFSSATLTSDGKTANKDAGWAKDTGNMRSIGGGFFAYFDATYAMASVGMNFYGTKSQNSSYNSSDDPKVTLTTLDIELFGKYPFEIGAFTVFPLLGVDFKIALSQTSKPKEGDKTKWGDGDGEGSAAGDLTTIWFKLGAGADIPLPIMDGKLYLRPMITYGIGTSAKTQKDLVKAEDNFKGFFNHGFDIKIAAGYKF